MSANGRVETFEGNFADFLERKGFADAQFGDGAGGENLLGLCLRTETRRELNRASEKIVVVFNRFAGGDANPKLNRPVLVFL